MMMRWIAFAGGAAVLGGGAWYFGQPEAPPVVVPPVPVVAPAPVVATYVTEDVPPLKVVQVIDLARAYEPVPEPEPTPGVDVAKFIEAGTVPDRMPYADAKVKPASFWTDAEPAGPEHLKVMPRVVDPFNLLHMEDPNARMAQLLNESEDLRQAREEMAWVWMNNQPMPLAFDRLEPAAVKSQKLDVMPRVVEGNSIADYFRVVRVSGIQIPGSTVRAGVVSRTERLDVMPREISTWNCGQPTKLEYERVSGPIGP